MSFEPSGDLTTDERQVATSTVWDTQTEWEAYQSLNNLQIENGVVKLASTIPDSAVYRWPVDEGSGQTLTDELQLTDISLNFETWTTGSQYVGAAAINTDGVDDQGTTASALPEIGINQTFSVEVWSEPEGLGESDVGNLVSQITADGNRFALGFDQNGNGNIAGVLYDGSNFVANASTSITLNDGLKQIVYTYDSSTSSGTIYVDSVEGSGTQRPNMSGTTEDSFYLANNAGQQSAWDGIVDLIQPHDEVLSQSQIDSLYQDHPST